jgi:hypothetical protein
VNLFCGASRRSVRVSTGDAEAVGGLVSDDKGPGSASANKSGQAKTAVIAEEGWRSVTLHFERDWSRRASSRGERIEREVQFENIHPWLTEDAELPVIGVGPYERPHARIVESPGLRDAMHLIVRSRG